jgi:hypothetical protein
MARRPQPHILYLTDDRRDGPWVRRGIYSSAATAERQAGRYRFTPGTGWVALPVWPGESWPELFDTGADLDAHQLQQARQRRGELSA